MCRIRRYSLCLSLATILGISSPADARTISADMACKILKAAAVQHHFAMNPEPSGYYRCDVEPDATAYGPDAAGYFLIGLHYNFHTPPGWIGSNLVGWYAVRRADGKVFEFDMAHMEVGPAIPD